MLPGVALDVFESGQRAMAGPEGFEPPACRLGGGRSIRLSYGPVGGSVPQDSKPARRLVFRYIECPPCRLLFLIAGGNRCDY